MKKQKVDYKQYKKQWARKNPEQAKHNVLRNTDIDPRFIKPHTLLEYEKDEDRKLFEDEAPP